MALDLVAGAMLGVSLGEVLNLVLVSNFHPMLKRLEKTLGAIIPRLEEIRRLNRQLKLEEKEMDELLLLENGKTLLVKCWNISPINFVKKVQYSKELLHLENELSWYFNFVLPSDQARDTKELLSILRKMCMKIAPDADQDFFMREKPKIYEDSMEQQTLDLFSEKQRLQTDQNYRDGAEEMFAVEDCDASLSQRLTVAGALIGVALGELLKVVLDVKQKSSNNFQPMLKRLEKTLRAIIQRLDKISCFNHELNLQREEMDELLDLLNNGETLLVKCSNISPFNLFKKRQYSKELLDLQNGLLCFFTTILSLDQARDNTEILFLVRELRMKLSGNDQNGPISPTNDLGCFNDDAKDGEPKRESDPNVEALGVLSDLVI